MDEYDIKKIEGCLKKHPVVFAYIFGSEAKGAAGALSDIDIAVYLKANVKKADRFDLRLRLTNDMSAILGKRVDLVVINDSPVHLSYEIISQGKIIFCNDRSALLNV